MHLRMLCLLVAAWPSCDLAAEIDTTMFVVEAIDAVRAEGVRVSYSSRLVEPGMRVQARPQSMEPLAALREVLACLPVYRTYSRPGQHASVVDEQHIADADFVTKARAGRADEIVHCISCNQGCFDAVFNLSNPMVNEKSYTLEMYSYYEGIMAGKYSYATAITLTQAVVGLLLVISANQVYKRATSKSVF